MGGEDPGDDLRRALSVSDDRTDGLIVECRHSVKVVVVMECVKLFGLPRFQKPRLPVLALMRSTGAEVIEDFRLCWAFLVVKFDGHLILAAIRWRLNHLAFRLDCVLVRNRPDLLSV